jgi:hypothetical protein
MKKTIESLNYFQESKEKLNILDIISEPVLDEESNPLEILEDRKNLDILKNITKDNYKTFLKIHLFTIINDLIDNDIFTPLIEQIINNTKESFEKMSEKNFFNNIKNKIMQAKENINKLFAILSSNLNNELKMKIEKYINNIEKNLTTFYYDRIKLVNNNFDEKKTLQESMKKNIIDAYEKKNFDKNKISMNEYIEQITDHLVTPIATNKENFSFFFIFCLFREDIINCICDVKKEELDKKKKQLDEQTKEYIIKLVEDWSQKFF